MAQSALIAAFLAGLLGGVHCIAMCGGYIAAFSRLSRGVQPLMPARQLWLFQVAGHGGRVTTYIALGVVLGAAGGAALGASWGATNRVLYALANVFLFLLAISIARGQAGFPVLERAGLAVFARAMPAVSHLARSPGLAARFGLGLVWGLTPCALVYGVLPVAMMSGSALDGGLVMLAFGVGTLPSLFAAGWVVGKANPVFEVPAIRIAAGVLIAGFAVVGMWRAIFMPAALGHGPFCIVP